MYSVFIVYKILTFIALVNGSSSSITKPSDNDFDCANELIAGLLETISIRCGLLFSDCRDTFDLFAIPITPPKPSSGVFLFECLGFMLSEPEIAIDSSMRVKTTCDFSNFSSAVLV